MAKTHSHLLKGLPECIPSTDIPLFQQWKGGARKWIHCAQSAFARKVFILYSKTYNKGRNTVISAWTSASKVWIVLRWAIEITCPVVCVWCLPDKGWECTITDPATGEFVPGGVTEQTIQVFENIKNVLAEAGLTTANIVKTTVFLADMSLFAEMNAVYAKYFEGDFPARSAVAVKALPKGALVEIESIAVR